MRHKIQNNPDPRSPEYSTLYMRQVTKSNEKNKTFDMTYFVAISL